MGKYFFTQHYRIFYKVLGIAILVVFIGGCQKPITKPQEKENVLADSIKQFLNAKQKIKDAKGILSFMERHQQDLNKADQITLYNKLGNYYRYKSVFAKAVINHQKALELAQELKDTVQIVQVANQLGTDYRRIGTLANAAKAHFLAMKTAEAYSQKETIKGKKLRSFSLNGIGNIYKIMGKGHEAYGYFKRSAKLDKEIDNKLGMAMNFVTMGSVMEYQGKLDSAFLFYKKALHYDSLVNSTTGIAICHNKIGHLLIEQKQWNNALTHYQIALQILNKKHDVWNKLRTQNAIAYIFIKTEKYDEANLILNDIKQVARDRKMYRYLSETNYLLASLHKVKKNYKQAAELFRESIVYSDSLNRINSRRKVIDARVQFEQEMSNHRIQDLNREKELEKSNSERKLITSIIIVVLLLVLLILVYFLFLTQRKNNKALTKSNQLRDRLFSIISHDLKAPVIAQKVAIDNIVNFLIQDTKNEELLSFCNILRENTENQISVIENMMHWTNLQTDKIKYTPQVIDIVPIINDELKLYKIPALQKNIEWEKEMPKSCIVYADKQMISIVIRNLINNAIKFTHEKGTIKVVCKCNTNNVSVEIIDSGVGMSKEQIAALYTKEQKIQINFGTKGEKGTGLGLILCKDLLEQNQSRLRINSIVGKGTTMQFSLNKTPIN